MLDFLAPKYRRTFHHTIPPWSIEIYEEGTLVAVVYGWSIDQVRMNAERYRYPAANAD